MVSKKVVEGGQTGPGVLAFGKSSALVKWGSIRDCGFHLYIRGLAPDRRRRVACPCCLSGTRRAWNEHIRDARQLAVCPFRDHVPMPPTWDNFGGCLVQDGGYWAEGYIVAVDPWRFLDEAD